MKKTLKTLAVAMMATLISDHVMAGDHSRGGNNGGGSHDSGDSPSQGGKPCNTNPGTPPSAPVATPTKTVTQPPAAPPQTVAVGFTQPQSRSSTPPWTPPILVAAKAPDLDDLPPPGAGIPVPAGNLAVTKQKFVTGYKYVLMDKPKLAKAKKPMCSGKPIPEGKVCSRRPVYDDAVTNVYKDGKVVPLK
jgi:hypothetical protein